MTSTSPPPRKSGTSKGYVVLTVVMLMSIGAMLLFKLTRRPAPVPPPPPPTPIAAATATPPPPPPPPPPPVPTASADAAPATRGLKPKRSVAECAGECEGRVTGPLTSALHAKGGQARGCYERALRQNSTLEGKVSVQVRVSSDGQVCGAAVTADTIRDPGVTSCILQLFRSGRFPRPTEGCVDVNVPMSFVPKS
jgi:hypothetical protein